MSGEDDKSFSGAATAGIGIGTSAGIGVLTGWALTNLNNSCGLYRFRQELSALDQYRSPLVPRSVEDPPPWCSVFAHTWSEGEIGFWSIVVGVVIGLVVAVGIWLNRNT